jgi:hypothetical protein
MPSVVAERVPQVMPLWNSLTLYRLEIIRRRLHHRPPRYSSTQAGDALA